MRDCSLVEHMLLWVFLGVVIATVCMVIWTEYYVRRRTITWDERQYRARKRKEKLKRRREEKVARKQRRDGVL